MNNIDTQQLLKITQIADNPKNIAQLKQDKRNAEEQQRVNRMAYDRLVTERDDVEAQIADKEKLTKIVDGKAVEPVDNDLLASKKKTLDDKISVQDKMIKEKQTEINRLNLLLKNNN